MNDTKALVIAKLLAGFSVDGHSQNLPDTWSNLAQAILAAPTPAERTRAFDAALAGLPEAAAIREAVYAVDPAADFEPGSPGAAAEPVNMYAFDPPALPDAAWVDPALGADACPWLDSYIDFSRLWSPRAFDGFHEAVGLWVLSTVAARRVQAHMGKVRFTNLFIALTARTSLFAKSSTAEIGTQLIAKAGLYWLLAADSATPQKFLADLTKKIPDEFDEVSPEQQENLKRRLSFAGQRGWYYDEFGQHVAAMMREGGFMADFRGLLRRFDDTPDQYAYGTIGRGTDTIERPYLALLANLTPDDLRQFARRGSALWGDGFLARFALITPPEGERLRDRFPQGERIIPGDLLTPIVDWHKRLGVPQADVSEVVDENNTPAMKKRLRLSVSPNVINVLDIPPDVKEAFYCYHDGLLDLVDKSDNHDLDGNYARLAEKALRVSILLASVSGSGLSMAHWARSQEITERWRSGLHQLYSQINEPGPSAEREAEERLLVILNKLGGAATAAEAARYMRNLSSAEAARLLDGLADAGELDIENTAKKTRRYRLRGEGPIVDK